MPSVRLLELESYGAEDVVGDGTEDTIENDADTLYWMTVVVEKKSMMYYFEMKLAMKA